MARHALAIGIERYPHLDDLKFAADDATNFGMLLKEPETHFDSVDVITSTSRLHISDTNPATLSASAITNVVQKLAQRAEPGDELLFFFSGHGCLHSGSGRDVLLGATDTRYDDLPASAVNVRDLVKILSISQAAQIALVIDACRHVKTPPAESESFKSFGEAIWSINEPIFSAEHRPGSEGKHWELLTACSDGEGAKELRGGPINGGAWTLALKKAVDLYRQALRDSLTAEPHTLQQLFREARSQHFPNPPPSEPWYHATAGSMVLLEIARTDSMSPDRILRQKDIRTYAIPVTLHSTDRARLSPHKEKDVMLRQSSVHLVPFQSGYAAKYLASLPHLIRQANTKFDIRLYLPNLQKHKPPFTHLYVMINGLAEANAKIPDDVGLHLAKQGIPSVLMPLPRHFTRFVAPEVHEDPYRPDEDSEKLYSQQILQTVYKHPNHLMFMYEQIASDVRQFVSQIDGIDDGNFPALEGLFQAKPRVSLFGYSFGGLCVLGILLDDFETAKSTPPKIEEEKLNKDQLRKAQQLACDKMRYSTGVILESGLPLDQIDTSKLYKRVKAIPQILSKAYCENTPIAEQQRQFIEMERLFSEREYDKQEKYKKMMNAEAQIDPKVFERDDAEAEFIWRDIILALHDHVDAGKHAQDDSLNLFRRVFLGNHLTRNRLDLNALNRKLLFIAGGEDEVFPALDLLQGPMGGLATLQVPGMSHWLKISGAPHWEYWRDLIVDLAVGFERAYSDSKLYVALKGST